MNAKETYTDKRRRTSSGMSLLTSRKEILQPAFSAKPLASWKMPPRFETEA